jgi:hypothetical protein
MESTSSSNQKRPREEDLRDLNRNSIQERPRQWATVDDDDDIDQESSKSINNSDNDDSSSTSSSSSSSSEQKKAKKAKKQEKKERKEKKAKSDKKSKKEKKEKKSKKEKKRKSEKHSKSSDHKHVSSSSSMAVDQNQFGKYGIIREENYFHKQREFEAYITEVKCLPAVLGQGKREVMKYFRDFIEDYNTGILFYYLYIVFC